MQLLRNMQSVIFCLAAKRYADFVSVILRATRAVIFYSPQLPAGNITCGANITVRSTIELAEGE